VEPVIAKWGRFVSGYIVPVPRAIPLYGSYGCFLARNLFIVDVQLVRALLATNQATL
jgi:hypothetical protein